MRPIRKAKSVSPVTAPRSRRRTITRSFRFLTAATNTPKSSGAFVISSIASGDILKECGCRKRRWTWKSSIFWPTRYSVHDLVAISGETCPKSCGASLEGRNGGRVDPSTPYMVRLPSGKQHRRVLLRWADFAGDRFRKLLVRGENLAGRLMSAFSDRAPWPQLVHIATDGETYGHHHRRGDMALAYALHHIEATSWQSSPITANTSTMHPPRMKLEISGKSPGAARTAWSAGAATAAATRAAAGMEPGMARSAARRRSTGCETRRAALRRRKRRLF